MSSGIVNFYMRNWEFFWIVIVIKKKLESCKSNENLTLVKFVNERDFVEE